MPLPLFSRIFYHVFDIQIYIYLWDDRKIFTIYLNTNFTLVIDSWISRFDSLFQLRNIWKIIWVIHKEKTISYDYFLLISFDLWIWVMKIYKHDMRSNILIQIYLFMYFICSHVIINAFTTYWAPNMHTTRQKIWGCISFTPIKVHHMNWRILNSMIYLYAWKKNPAHMT